MEREKRERGRMDGSCWKIILVDNVRREEEVDI
jgi:hypothetical protein